MPLILILPVFKAVVAVAAGTVAVRAASDLYDKLTGR